MTSPLLPNVRAGGRSAKGPLAPTYSRWIDALRRWLTADILVGQLVTVLTLPAVWPLLQSGFVATRAGGDSPFLLIRLHQLLAGLALGFPVRWMPDAAHGLGYPFWNFYAPLPYYLAGLFSRLGLGYVAPLKLAQLLGFLVAAWAMYILGRDLWNQRAAGVLAAVAYTYAPFHLVNVYVRGDSLGEFWAFALYPLLWLATWRLLHRPAWTSAVALALAFAGLILSHNISALIFSPFLGLFGLLTLGRAQLKDYVVLLTTFGLSLLLGLCLSAWFWYPALAERSLVQLDVNLSGFFSYTGHFRGANLIQLDPVFNYDPANGTAFAIGLVQALAIGMGLFAVWVTGRGARNVRLALTVTLVAAVFCITPLSEPLWANLPLLPFAQFPWRWLSIVSFAGALLIGGIVSLIPLPFIKPDGNQTEMNTPIEWTFALSLSCLLIVTGVAGLDVSRIAVADSDVTAQQVQLYEIFSGNIGTTIRAEYLPAAVQPHPAIATAWLTPDGQATVVALTGTTRSIERLGAREWQVEVTSSDAEVAFPLLAYPGWQAWVDGQAAPSGVAPGLGYLTVRLSEGVHTLRFTFEHTPARRAAEVVSLLALWVVGGLLILDRGWLRFLIPSVLVLSGLWLLGLALRPADPPTTQLQTTNLDYLRVPWLHPSPQGIAYPHGAHLASYQVMTTTPASGQLPIAVAGERMTVALHWSAIAAGQADVVLVSPAEHRYGVSYQIANERVPVAPVTTHTLDIPLATTPGLYWLRLRVQDAATEEVLPLDDQGQARGRLYLVPVQVRAPAMSPPRPTAPPQRLNDTVSLLDNHWEQRTRTQLYVDLTWQTAAPLTDNYVTSIRLVDAEGMTVKSEDQPPGYGFFPTITWRPGEPIYDRRRLNLPDGLAPGVYSFDIILYQRATLAEVGRVQIPHVVLR